jgi:hypothetical protein
VHHRAQRASPGSGCDDQAAVAYAGSWRGERGAIPRRCAARARRPYIGTERCSEGRFPARRECSGPPPADATRLCGRYAAGQAPLRPRGGIRRGG